MEQFVGEFVAYFIVGGVVLAIMGIGLILLPWLTIFLLKKFVIKVEGLATFIGGALGGLLFALVVDYSFSLVAQIVTHVDQVDLSSPASMYLGFAIAAGTIALIVDGFKKL